MLALRHNDWSSKRQPLKSVAKFTSLTQLMTLNYHLFVSLRWFPGSMGFQNGAGMKTEKPLGTKLPFKSTRSTSRTLSWWVMKLSFGMILFFQDRGRLVGVTIFYFLFTVTSKFGGKAIFLSFFKWRSKIFWKFPKIVKYGKATLWKDKEYSTGPSEQGRGVHVSIRRLS